MAQERMRDALSPLGDDVPQQDADSA